ncbi:hypothetical protein PV336_16460 [Streptomyces sp. MI02-2A]|uniref:hypothetical protein n=1 Tax=Streptomyces sp. MI02-2A TaxID=3028688 RepID=UPI0029A7170F|nr:hypothetical protein [Streptomyces sp. MI02-2A]MDX3260811.1 hypothetical protein [Streptomyces sp. MI02-2A]
MVNSRKDSDGNWEPYERSVTTVVERDDEGYPYGPIQSNRANNEFIHHLRVYEAWKQAQEGGRDNG